MLNQKVLDRLSANIQSFKDFPEKFGNNEWRCYSDCKRLIEEDEKRGIANWDDYNDYIKFITAKLNI